MTAVYLGFDFMERTSGSLDLGIWHFLWGWVKIYVDS